MANRLRLAPHLTEAELAERYRSAARPVEQRHWQVIWLLAKGWRTADIAEATDYSVVWVRKLCGRYNADGPEALLDGRRNNPGKAPLLDEVGRAKLKQAIEHEPPPSGGNWNGPKVAEWMTEHLGRPVGPVRGWDYLRRLGYTPQRPRRRHEKADEEAQRAYKRPVAWARA